MIIDSGEVAVLNATGTGNIIWQDEYGNNLFEGDSYSTNPLFENTSYYVVNEEVIVEPESFFTGAEEHEGNA